MKRLSVLLSASVIILLVISLAISCTSEPAPSPEEPVILRLVMEPHAGDPQIVEAEAMAERLYERTGGAYQIEVYAGGSLLNTTEYFDAVRTGAVEMMCIGWGVFAGADPRLGAMEIPFLFNNVQANASVQESYVELFDPIFQEKFNQKTLASDTVGGFELYSNRPVRTLEDWNGLMVGTMTPPMADLTNELGGSPIVVMFVDLYTNLEKGVIDAVLVPPVAALAAQLPDIASNATFFYASSGAMGYTINLDAWNAMSKDTQDILLEETKQATGVLNEMSIMRYDEDIAKFKAMGMDVYIVPKEERDRWVEKYQPSLDAQLSALGEFGQKVKQIADEANSQFP